MKVAFTGSTVLLKTLSWLSVLFFLMGWASFFLMIQCAAIPNLGVLWFSGFVSPALLGPLSLAPLGSFTSLAALISFFVTLFSSMAGADC
jgi:hypothetical protein